MNRAPRLPWRVRARLPVTRRLFALRLRLARRSTLAALRWQRALRWAEPSPLRLVTIAFNNPAVLAHQARLLAENVLDEHVWIVADNSTRRAARRAHRRVSSAYGALYLRLPRNPYTGRDPSRSHAEALNYVARRLAVDPEGTIVGFLDHDVFPVRPVSLTYRMRDVDVYGRRRERRDGWYLWPGLLFLRAPTAGIGHLDFHPCVGGDTGARLAESVYSGLDVGRVAFMQERKRIQTGRTTLSYEELDEWVHTVNASYWRAEPPKETAIAALLKGIEEAAE